MNLYQEVALSSNKVGDPWVRVSKNLSALSCLFFLIYRFKKNNVWQRKNRKCVCSLSSLNFQSVFWESAVNVFTTSCIFISGLKNLPQDADFRGNLADSNFGDAFCSVIVCNVHYRSNTTHIMPDWVVEVFMNRLAPWLGVERPSAQSEEETPSPNGKFLFAFLFEIILY